MPTITGAISSILMSGVVTEGKSASDIDEIESDLADIYGVDTNDVETSIDYVSSGVLDIVIPEDLPVEESIIALQDSLADVLGVHPKDIVVSIDEDGQVSYSVSSGSFKEAEAIRVALFDFDFESRLEDDLEESGIEVKSSSPNADIEISIAITVDTTDRTGTVDVNDAVAELVDET